MSAMEGFRRIRSIARVCMIGAFTAGLAFVVLLFLAHWLVASGLESSAPFFLSIAWMLGVPGLVLLLIAWIGEGFAQGPPSEP